MIVRSKVGGFSLLEVLVALSIVAITLMAGLQASGAVTRGVERQADMLLAQVCAENELIKIKLLKQLPSLGIASAPCSQGNSSYSVETSVKAASNANFRHINVRVLRDAQPVLMLSTVVGGG